MPLQLTHLVSRVSYPALSHLQDDQEQFARMVDAGTIRTTVQENFGKINAANLKRAHAQIESGTTRGKIVLEGF